MFERLNDADLLALIEDEADSKASASLRAKLAGDEDAIAMLERMRQDRALLRSTPEPVLPVDLLTALEPLLARPMLIQTPGTDRRRRHRQQRRMRWLAASLAAMLALAAGTGALLSWSKMRSSTDSQPDSIARVTIPPPSPDASPAPIETASAPADENWPPQGATIHHRLPLHGADAAPALVSTAGGGTRPSIASAPAAAAAGTPGSPGITDSSRGALVASPFALVVETEDAQRVTETIRQIVRELGTGSALVRNMTAAEAGPIVADVEGKSPSAPGSAKARNELAGPRGAAVKDHLLEGSGDLQAPPEQQVMFSTRGAQLTISVPMDQLDSTLARLSELHGRLMSVTSLATPGPGKDSQMSTRTLDIQWLAQIGLIRDSIGPIEQAVGRRVLLLPVVVREKR